MRRGDRLSIAGLVTVALVAVTLALPAQKGIVERDALAQGDTIYVDAGATGANDGTSWEDAYITLQPALDDAGDGDEIWVAAGVYKPTYEFSPGDPRSATFQLKNGAALYGGFTATETSRDERNWILHETVLSGDIGIEGDASDNSYHVFYHPSGTNLDSTAILDGFTLTGGNANLPSNKHWCGGGMFSQESSPALSNVTFAGNSADDGGGMSNERSSPVLANCTFSGNSASSGAGMHNSLSSPMLSNCRFAGNAAASRGGGMYNIDSSPMLTDCTLEHNSAGSWGGGGMFNAKSLPILTNCSFSGNSASSEGGGMYNFSASSPTVINSILWGDTPDEIFNGDTGTLPVVTYSDIQGGYSGTGNIDADPLFLDPENGDYHLSPGSPCIDAGSNHAPNLPDYDFEGDPRIIDGNRDGMAIVDMGVDEAFWHRMYLQLIFRSYAAPAPPPPPQKVALLSFHGRYVTALGEDGDWRIKQETALDACGVFALHHLENGRVALVTCWDRYVTAPRTGSTRWDWRLGQEPDLSECGEFILRDLGSDGIAFETCAGRFFTAGDDTWPGELAWSIVAETDYVHDWERYTLSLQP